MPQTDGVGEDEGAEARIDAILRSIDPTDVDGLEPPDEIWAGIEATLADERRSAPRRSPTRDAEPRLTIEYRIDADDVVLAGDGWAEAARADAVPELAIPAPGRTLWSHMAEGETRDLWQLLTARVRERRTSVTIPFRCDGPSARRWFEMTVSPEADGSIAFRSDLVFAESRDTIALLELDIDRDPTVLPVLLCAWCGRGEVDGAWVELEELVRARRLLEVHAVPSIDTGVCGDCRDEMRAELGTLVTDA